MGLLGTMMITQGRNPKTAPIKSKMQKGKYETNLNPRKTIAKMERQSQREMYKVRGSSICDANSTSL